MQEYEYLGKLQLLDNRIDELSDKLADLPEERAYKNAESELKKVMQEQAAKEDTLASQKSIQKKVEDELELVDLKIKHEDAKLYSGKIGNPKELKGIQEEVALLKRKKDKMETDLLELLDTVDNLNSELAVIKKEIRNLNGTVRETEEEYKKIVKEINDETQELNTKKEALKPKISGSLLSLYEQIRKKKKQATVAIADGICQGCFVELPAEEIDKMLDSDDLWRCPQCRRILLR
jgi:predicted  nucleic acid-binding Zn-ribbon protein